MCLGVSILVLVAINVVVFLSLVLYLVPHSNCQNKTSEMNEKSQLVLRLSHATLHASASTHNQIQISAKGRFYEMR